ncbi:MAG: hypothetical protein LC777_02950 [Actinobacteria bacterium]|nr:hypothetical protein [Actinomycetota bacterium]
MNDLALVQGMQDTRLALRRWSRAPMDALGPWLALSLGVAVALLCAVWLVAELSTPDSSFLFLPGLYRAPGMADYLYVLFRNSLVLALHALACVAGFMAGSSIPISAASRTGLDRWVHEQAGRFAIFFVACATLFSLSTQAYVIGGDGATIARQLDLPPALLVLGLLPHALPELVALFLPLAAWLVASRREAWDELLAATCVTVSVAVPVLLLSGVVELWVSPDFLRALAGL